MCLTRRNSRRNGRSHALLGALFAAFIACPAVGHHPFHPPAVYAVEPPAESSAIPGESRAIATRRQLAEIARSPRWRLLLHYQDDLLGSSAHSLIDSPAFFLSPQGDRDPEAELRATIDRLFAGTQSDQPLYCDFPARYQFLCGELGYSCDFDFSRCPQLAGWLANYEGAAVSLIFASSYMNNPASMLGHTLLRFDRSARLAAAPLLEDTVNFAARTDERRGLGFALRGLTGGYRGSFSLGPYHRQVREYGHIDRRDLWEYRLALPAPRVRDLLLHLWELRRAYFDYYFIDENCSYHLLSLLQSALPESDLTSDFYFYAVPADTIRRVIAIPGLLREIHYRPSKTSLIHARERALSDLQRDAVARLFHSPAEAALEEFSPQEQAAILDLALDLTEIDPSHAEHQPRLLLKRNRLAVPAREPDLIPPADPASGHKSRRAAVNYGVDDGEQYLEAELRLLYHGTEDPERGQNPAAALEFGTVAGRYQPESGNFYFERLTLLDAISTPARTRFVKPLSWSVKIGAERRRFGGDKRALSGIGSALAGVSYQFQDELQVTGLAGGIAEINGRLANTADAAPAIALSAWFRPHPNRFRLGVESRVSPFSVDSNNLRGFDIGLTSGLDFDDNHGLAVSFGRRQEHGISYSLLQISLRKFF